MSGWNEDEIEKFAAYSAKCPNCGGNILYNEKLGRSVCGMCGGVFVPESLKSTGSFEKRDNEDAGDMEENKQEFVCDSCGATVVTDYNTAATFCAFCGSPTLIKRRLSKQFRPDVLVPFKVGHEEAVNCYMEWLKTNKGVPSLFKSKYAIEKITGIYIPFWLIDADCNTIISGMGRMPQDDLTAHFIIDRTITFKLTRVPFDGCKKIPDTLMEAIEPFDFRKLVPYNDMYLPGFYAQRYDKSSLDMLDLIGIRLNSYSESAAKQFTAPEYKQVTASAKGSYADNFKQLYALLPVWFLNVKYKDSSYRIAINGQTGKVSGSLPVYKGEIWKNAFLSTLKWVPVIAGGAALLSALSSLAVASSTTYFFDAFKVTFGVLGSACLIMYLAFVIAMYFKLSEEESITLNKAPGAEEYFDFGSKVEMTKNDKFSHFTSEPDPKEEAMLDLMYVPKYLR